MDEVFEHFDVDYCHFHLSKNAFANIQSKGLHAAYNNTDARELLRCLPALAFLPIQDVARGFEHVKNALLSIEVFRDFHLESNITDYLNYFEKTYIRRRVRGIPTEGLFPIEFWNCKSAAQNGLPRTNNHIEGWHKGFNERFRRAKMNLSQFIIRLKAEDEKTRQLVFRSRLYPAEPLRQPRRPAYEIREANLKALVSGYQPENMMEYLKTIQFHLAKFPFVIQEQENSSSEENEDI